MKKPLRLGFACAARSWMDARAFVPTVRVRLQHHSTVRVTVDLRSPRLALRTPRVRTISGAVGALAGKLGRTIARRRLRSLRSSPFVAIPPTGDPIVRPVKFDHAPGEVPPGALGSSQNHQPLGVGPKVLLFRTMSAVYAVTGLRPNSVQTQKFIPATWPVRNSSLLTTSMRPLPI